MSNARENATSRIAFTSFATVPSVDETASNIVPFIVIFNVGNKRTSVGAITKGTTDSSKSETTPEKCSGAFTGEDTRIHFPKTGA
jgi:hypothetical protein